ncbi:hypothetical protein [Lactobacillus sp. HT06-2]|uniref:hypothetical protein n=1 Tax=Lactobacillus sp. HT06-2 TaxID=2080222 RepID=UPI000CD8CC7E|nr:hypothetical protein [Lactobacillus sp. HT06-2]
MGLINQLGNFDRDKLVASGADHYFKYWRKVTHANYNKRDSLRLAKALQAAKPELSLYQAKLFISQLSW